MSNHDCPTDIELTRASAIPNLALEEHVASCARCAGSIEGTLRAIELARELPTELPPVEHREEVRTALLAAIEPRPAERRPSRWVVPFVVTATAAAIVAVIVRTSSSPAAEVAQHPHRGTVHAHGDAIYALASEAPDEIVRLRAGTIDIDVHPLVEGERFRVIVGTDEIEVHGTSFEVVAEADQLRSVHVVHGVVQVRHGGQSPSFLAAGQSWTSERTAQLPAPAPDPDPIPAAVPAAVPAPIPAPAPTPAPLPQPAPRPTKIALAPRPTKQPATPTETAVAPQESAVAAVATPVAAPVAAPVTAPVPAIDPQELAFNTGWKALRRGELQVAADAFGRAVALDPKGALAEDGAFWHSVALARLGKKGEATIALRSFLEDFSSSTRVGEASVMLGWMLVDVGELQEARQRFEAAINDPSASVHKSATAGLRALDARRP